MKKSLLLIFAFLTFYAGFSQVTLTTQAEVDAYAGGATVNGSLTIGKSGGSNITSLAALNSITSVTGYLYIYENSSLTNLTGLGNIGSVNLLYIGDNPELLNIDALSTSLTAIGDYFEVYRNAKLTSIAGLSGISSLIYGFYFEGCPLITDFTDLTSLTSLNGTIDVRNTGLTSFNGLPAITALSNYLNINNCDALNNFSTLSNLTSIGGALDIRDNLLLSDFNWLNKLTTVGAYLYIGGNDIITDLDGFDVLNSVAEYLRIDSNPELTSLNGIETLTNLAGYATGNMGRIQIDANPKLANISGAMNIDAVDITYLTIRNNTVLSTCEISNFCTYLETVGTRLISGNATGCVTDVEILAACATASVSDYLLKNAVSIYPNPTSDQLNIDIISDINIEHLTLYSMQGRLIKEQSYQLQSMDMSNVASGIYMLNIASDKGDINARIVKQ